MPENINLLDISEMLKLLKGEYPVRHIRRLQYDPPEFDVPTEILKNSNCSLSIALLVFNASDGILYLQDKEASEGTRAWTSFISNLYKKILNNDFKKGKTSFDPQLSRVQEFKLKKVLSEEEFIFITPIEGIDCYNDL